MKSFAKLFLLTLKFQDGGQKCIGKNYTLQMISLLDITDCKKSNLKYITNKSNALRLINIRIWNK